MVEGARLESVYTRKGIEGSNPSLSAEKNLKSLQVIDLQAFLLSGIASIDQGQKNIQLPVSKTRVTPPSGNDSRLGT